MPNDFTLNPDFVFETTPTFNTIVSKFENGTEQRRAKWATQLREWNLQYRNRLSTDRDTVNTLFTTKLGQATSFTWTNPADNQTYTVRFKEDKITFTLHDGVYYDFDFTLVEVK